MNDPEKVGIETVGKSRFQVIANSKAIQQGLTARQAGGSSDAWSPVEMPAKVRLRGKNQTLVLAAGM